MLSTRVKVQQGTVLGCEELLPNGKKYIRFSGIPYANFPSRFQPSQKLTKFDTAEIDCTEERDPCFHRSTLTKKFVGSEDCLNLNVYVPVRNGSRKLTVMVYIHGGSLKYESNTRQLYSPEHLLINDVIIVTINYRLHILGFLSLPAFGIHGNNGLKDQQIALQWTYENIANFNGDPENICLFGESAGATCVHFHVLNEKSRKFIKSAICQSGTAFSSVLARLDTVENDVFKVAKLLGYKSDSIAEAFETLLKAPVQDLYENCEGNPKPIETILRMRRWLPVVEPESENAFLTKTILNLFVSQAGKVKIPMIFGTNDGDGMARVAGALKILDKLNENISIIFPKDISMHATSLATLSSDFKKFYFGNKDVSNDSLNELCAFFSDLIYLWSQTLSVDAMSLLMAESKLFLNEFRFVGKLNIQKKLVKLEELKGACHADDLFYLFGGVLESEVQRDPDSREEKVRANLCRMWTNFAKFNDPTPECDDFLKFKWDSIKPLSQQKLGDSNHECLVIDDNPRMVKNMKKHRMDFFKSKFRNFSSCPQAAAKL